MHNLKNKNFKKGIAVLFVAVILLFSIFLWSCSNFNQEKTKIAALKGPTSLGAIMILDKYNDDYEFNCYAQTDALLSNLANGSIDIALLPANLAATLYNKANNIKVIDVNTLIVLQFISNNKEINKLEDLKGKTLYSIGKNTLVETILEIILQKKNINIKDINIQYKSEAAEVISTILKEKDAVGLINEPQASIAQEKYPNLIINMNVDTIWKEIFGTDKNAITGVAVATKSFIDNNKNKVDTFLQRHKESIDFVNNNTEKAAQIWREKIDDNLIINKNSIKNSNIFYIDGQDMKSQLKNFYKLFAQYNYSLISNKIPDDEFYYIK